VEKALELCWRRMDRRKEKAPLPPDILKKTVIEKRP
jgi:hypothetical protein